MRPGILTFTNLFPSAAMPTHGLFVRERMARVAAAGDFRWEVVAPVPKVAFVLRQGIYRRWAEVPDRELVDSVPVHHPRYRHWPGFSLRRQADAMAEGARSLVRAITGSGRWLLDAHYLWPDGVAAARLGRELGLPYALTARGSDLNVVAQDRAVASRIAEAAAGAAFCAAVSEPLCARFAEVAGLPRERVRLLRNGVDLDRFHPGDQAAARAALGLPAAGRWLLGVGRLVPGKGFGLAAECLAGLPADVGLLLVGDGPERGAIQRLGGERVRCLGALPPDQVALCYRAADLLVLPSEREGWPNVVTEALASGLPVVASRVGGVPQILGDPPPPERGALVPPGDAAALGAALAATLAVPRQPAAVRAWAGQFGWDEPVAQIVALCRDALATAGGAA